MQRILIVLCLGACASGSDEPTTATEHTDATDTPVTRSTDDTSTSLVTATADTSEPTDPDSWMPPVTCGDWVSPGPDMLEGTVEAEQDFARLLQETDTSKLPDPLDLSGLSRFEKGVVNWMAGRKRGDELPLDELDDAGMLGEAIKVAFARGSNGQLDFFALREGLQYGYQCSRPLPVDLSELVTRYGDYTTWLLADIPCGLPKDERRKVWHHPTNDLIVAETVAEDGSVRETEVLFWSLRDDEQLDFAAYDEAGDLMDRSTFATAGAGPITFGAPYICISCHMGFASVDEQSPDGLGAGCTDP